MGRVGAGNDFSALRPRSSVWMNGAIIREGDAHS